MTLSRSLLIAIARAVEAHGGGLDDVDDLVATWERLAADKRGRVDRLRYEAAHPRCICADHGVDDGNGRCERCYGLLSRELAR